MKNASLESLIEVLLSCDECCERFTDQTDMKYHIRTNHVSKISKYNVCGKGWRKTEILPKHVESEQRENEHFKHEPHIFLVWVTRIVDLLNLFKLKDRNIFFKGIILWNVWNVITFFYEESLNRHVRFQQESNFIYQCRKCNNTFWNDNDLKCHNNVVYITLSD